MNSDHGTKSPRRGCIDMWNAFMVKHADFTVGSDIPICRNTRKYSIPDRLISYEEAKAIYRKRIKEEVRFHENAFVHFYIDDQKFDGKRSSIWTFPFRAWRILRHFDGIITPDFSTNADFPDPIKRYNTYRMRGFGVWMGNLGISVINNVRWGTEETWEYCFDGIPQDDVVAIGTVASGIKEMINRPMFYEGFYKMVDLLNPKTILVYGSANYSCFEAVKERGIQIIEFSSNTKLSFERRRKHE